MASLDIRVVPLGAGQDVGRSCILVSMGGKNIMLDCGMHMGYQDERRFPDFSYIGGGGRLTDYLDCVIISHFHLDHCGSLPHMSEVVGYDGPIYMTYPSKAIVPVLLEDYRKVQTEFKGETNFFTSANIKNCMKKVIAVNLHETIDVDEELSIRAFYAGHVLGAAMFEVRVGKQSDYNMTPDRHLGAARVLPGIRPDLLISESTYATTIRDSKRARERDFLRKVHDTVMSGGKVLIPVFALGRAQELCILLEQYWERMDLKFPVYFSQGLAERAREYYRLFINWTNEKIKNGFVERNQFDFKHIKALERNAEDMPGPMVLFSTPGMLHGGQSLKVFKKWCGDSKNMIIMPGYCVAGTVGAKVIGGMKRVEIDGKNHDINLSVEYMSFSAHADAKGIMELIRQTQCRHVMFVHGEAAKMEFLGDKVKKEFKIPVHMPANGETVIVPGEIKLELEVPQDVVERSISLDPTPAKRHCPFSAALVVTRESGPQIVSLDSFAKTLELPIHIITQSQIITGNISMNWDLLMRSLSNIDPELQLKNDGVEMFHGEMCVMKVDSNEREVEVVWEESREGYLPKVFDAVNELLGMLEVGQLVSEWLPVDEIVLGCERGDLLEFRRTAQIGQTKRRSYTHWAVYIGKLEGIPRVVHFSTPDGDFDGITGESKLKDSFTGISKIVKGTAIAEIRCDPLHDVAQNDLLRINNALDATHRPFPPNIIVERATHQLGAGDYNIITNNCEHFCKYCRYGNKISSQAVAAKSIALTSVLALGLNPSIALGAGLLFAVTSESVSRFLHRKFSTNFRFF